MRAVVALLALVTGSATSVSTVAVHQLWWGLPLGAAATLAALVALGPGWWTRLPFAVGWVGLTGYLTTPRAGGGFLVSADPAGYLLMVLALVVTVFSLATLPRPGRRPGDVGDPS